MTVVDTTVTLEHEGRTFTVPTGLFINNEFVPSIAGQKFKTVDPATGEVICEVYEALKEDVDHAVSTAKKAFKSWSKVIPADRGRMMYKLADLMERDIDILAGIESWDNGKVFTEARFVDLPKAISNIRYYAGWADKLHGKVVEMDENHHTFIKHEPFGVVGQIIPWNFPLLMLAWKLGPALCTGNVIVMKSSEKTPLSALKFCELIKEAGFPPGVFNLLSGFGPTAGEAIARHMDIMKVAFTGSTGVGRRIMAAAATSNLKKVSLELGGKSPNIVFDDANLDLAVAATKIGFTLNHGQTCCAGTRVYVQEGVYDKFVEKLRDAAASIKLGGQFHPESNHGPLVDEIQFNRVMGYIEDGKKAGAKVVYGGERHGDKGYFVKPTIFSEVHDDMKVVREEIFGPVVCVMKFKTTEEIVERANNSNYGLAAAIHTTNLSTAHRVANELESGTVWVNTYNLLTEQMPFGGYKESGFGRENSEYALHEYTRVKAVFMAI
ncbi:aldehyde dehydrogenase (NAD(P)(+)) ald5 [Dinochytrium kinnereticum]|nr:aldehyde dehydrogenase (NAD(P)(+)) ald5 [Dinochytrium kinnereticum]